MKELYLKLKLAKAEIGAISKDMKNPFYNSKYFDINKLLEHVEPVLENHDLIILQPILDGKVITLIIDVETGQTIESSLQLPEINDPQKLGSAITYYRRYTLQSLLALQADDDDANTATEAIKNQSDDKPWINIGDKAWNKAVEIKLSIEELRKHYKISKANAEQYLKEIK